MTRMEEFYLAVGHLTIQRTARLQLLGQEVWRFVRNLHANITWFVMDNVGCFLDLSLLVSIHYVYIGQ